MNYLSTRNNHPPVSASMAIKLGMVPAGGLFVPETVPAITPFPKPVDSYQTVAKRVIAPFLTDFSDGDLTRCIAAAYSYRTFDTPDVVDLVPLDADRSIMELWHGPTAAFKDVALQIMPHFLAAAKRNIGDTSHTVILVATSGDTGKAALEGFKNCEGISIIVFYPHRGVSKVQELQMSTTDGANTYVVAVNGNFDDCQTGVKRLLGDARLRELVGKRGFEFSSANSINWGRLCPQIVYYWTSYLSLIGQGRIKQGDAVDFCVPTGNFGNILAGYYARRMGLPVGKLICASNRNNVLADFFATGTYDSKRTFHRTMSPSMDILVSSNLERFLFEVTGHDAEAVTAWSRSLEETGVFSVDAATRAAMQQLISASWVGEDEVLATIGDVYKKTGYVLDTHTAVAVAASDRGGKDAHAQRPVVIASTASPYKFSRDVLAGMTGKSSGDEFQSVKLIAEISGMPVHRALTGLERRPVRHQRVIGLDMMEQTLSEIMATVEGPSADKKGTP
jgi:threonine synthase